MFSTPTSEYHSLGSDAQPACIIDDLAEGAKCYSASNFGSKFEEFEVSIKTPDRCSFFTTFNPESDICAREDGAG